jgi:hypothetical protein
MRKKTLTMEDAIEARKLVDFPGGLELHIGVCIRLAHKYEHGLHDVTENYVTFNGSSSPGCTLYADVHTIAAVPSHP